VLTIPEYYRRFVDSNADLRETPKLKCPFHKEENGQSFSYSAGRELWRCFGACKSGGDVIDLHKLNFHLPTRREAEQSLRSLLGLRAVPKSPLGFPKPAVNAERVSELSGYGRAVKAAKTPSDWAELDLIMSAYPPDSAAISMFAEVRNDRQN
jgi:hypothetical protein